MASTRAFVRALDRPATLATVFLSFVMGSCAEQDFNIDQIATTKSGLTITSLPATADSRLNQYSPTSEFGNEASVRLDGDNLDGMELDSDIVLRWNVSTIPAGNTVSAVNVKIYMKAGNSSNQSFNVFE